ncbi:cytochrome P450 [Streptomyces sp. 1222.5]|uniref:cytochrome P450 n=1 Tax=Streptomyces sp. 1222.5 TaxID=1881026 RepID=UPI003D7166FD
MDDVRQGALPLRAVAEDTPRWNPPFLLGVCRFALEDVAVGGTVIAAGGRVWISLASANRDERQFPSPDTFDPNRLPAHLAFGHGFHQCLGAPLARLEMWTTRPRSPGRNSPTAWSVRSACVGSRSSGPRRNGPRTPPAASWR